MRRSSVIAFTFVLVQLLGVARLAQADDATDKQVQRLNKRAMDDYDSLEFESARRTLQDALEKLRGAGLDDSATAAKTYLNLGIVYINGFKDKNRGQQQFVNALKINPQIKIDPAVATPETDEAFAAAKRALPTEDATTPPAANPPLTAPATGSSGADNEVHGLQHVPADESKPNAPVPLRAKLGADTGASKLVLFYRGSGQEDFIAAPMKNTSGVDWVGVIPPDAVVGKSLQYYLEGRDARGRAVVNAGSASNPFVVLITDTAAAPTNVPEVDVEDPLMRERAANRRRQEERKSTRDHVFVFLMPGFGFGVEPAGNHTEVAYQYQDKSTSPNYKKYVQQPVGSTGVAIAPFHLAAEIGYLITPRFSLSLVGRFQLVTGANAETQDKATAQGATSKANGAVAGFLRARYRFLGGRFHPYVHLDVGAGEIRHVIDVSDGNSPTRPLVDAYTAAQYNAGMTNVTQQTVCGNPKNCLDTVPLGLVFLGGGAGIWYDIGSHFAFIADVNILGAIGSGAGESGMNIDVQVGVGVHFL